MLRATRLLTLLGLVVLAAAVLAGCGGEEEAAPVPGETEPGAPAEEAPAEEPAEVRNVTYATSFGQFGRDAYAYVALEKGYFEEAGFDVRIVPGAGSVDNARLIAAGQLDYAPLDFSALAVTRANEDIPVKIVSFVHQQSMSAILTRADSGISSPADLEGRSIADSPGSTVRVMFPVYAERAGIDADAVTFRSAEPPALPSLLAAGQVDAVGQFVVGVPLFEQATEGEVIALPYAEYLPDVPGLGVAVSDQKLEQDEDEVQRFLEALHRGLQDALDDPQEAAEILVRHQPEANAEVAARELELMREYALTDYTDEHGIGAIDVERLRAALAIVEETFDLERQLEPDDVYAEGFAGSS
jgi:NitT/TauT family transport system substrate-binding protein